MAEAKKKVPVTEDPTKTKQAETQLKTDGRVFRDTLRSEPMDKVYGNPIFKQYLGKQYTFMYNSVPVRIDFDGKYYEYPRAVARKLEQKLADIAGENTPKELNEKIL